MRKITAWILCLAVLFSMGMTSFAELADGQTEPQKEIVTDGFADEEPTEDEEENNAAPQNIGGVDAETNIVVGDTTKTNLALGKSVIIRQQNYNCETSAKLTDGKTNTVEKQKYSGTVPNMYAIDLGSEQTINQIVIKKDTANPKIFGYTVQYTSEEAPTDASKLKTWNALNSKKWKCVDSDLFTETDTTNGIQYGLDTSNWGEKAIDFTAVQARYIRFVVNEVNTAWQGAYQLQELEVYNITDPRPVITLNGEKRMEIWQGETFTDPGATAVGADGQTNLTSEIKQDGTVDTTKAGIYILSYNVKEGDVAACTKVRRVKVKSIGVDLKYTSAVGGGVVSASYEKEEYDPKNGASYQWMRAEAGDGDYTDIDGATETTYTLTGADSGSYLKLKITPQGGAPVESTNHVSVGNLALGKTATLSANGAGEQANITDGNIATSKNTYSKTLEHTLVVDLGAKEKFNKVVIYAQNSKKIYTWEVQYSADNKSWTKIAEGTNSTANEWMGSNALKVDFDAVQARYVRFEVKTVRDGNVNQGDSTNGANYSGVDVQYYEFEVYNKPTAKPTITLKGTARTLAEKGTTFTDSGATAKDGAGEDITSLVKVSGTVDTSTVGNYTLTYTATDAWGNVADPVTRTVVVHEKDTEAPVITLNGAPKIRIHQNDQWTEPGATVTDNLDENVTVTIGGSVDIATLGTYTLTYDATDCYGNKAAQVTRTVTVVRADEDVTPPTVTLKGDATVEVWQGNAYQEAGATADDDGTDISDKIKVSGSVNTAVLGTYILTYSAEDAAGNIGIASRTVVVIPEPAIEQDKRELKIEGASDLNAITADLILRTKGAKGSTITWASSNENVIRSDGTVIRPTNGNASVILTATIANGGETRVKVFDAVTVLQKTGGGNSGGGGGRPSGGSTVSGNVSGTGGTLTPDTTVPSGGTTTVPEAGTLSGFADMKEVAWADLAVSELTKRGIISGVGNGNFEPSRAITREEFVKIIMNACGFASGAQTADFADVSADAWYAPYVAAAANLGLVGGTGDGTFGVGRDITREEMAAIICRAAQAKGIELSTAAGRADFTDDGAISDWAKENVYALQQAGILSGMGDGSFAPERQCTRAEAAKVVYELTKYMW